MSTFSRVLLGLFDFLKDLSNVAVLTFFDSSNFVHDVLEEVLNQHFGFLVTVHTLVNFDTDHLAQLVGYLNLAALEAIDFILNRVIDLS